MIKIDEEEFGTLSRCAPNEPIFVLRAQDKLAPALVKIWCQLAATHGVCLSKRTEAMELAVEMERWQQSNGSKVPD